MLIGTKCDLTEDRAVTREEAEQLAAEHNMTYFETSARGNINIQEAFSEMIDAVYNKKFRDPNTIPSRDTIKLSRPAPAGADGGASAKKKKGCCK